MKTDGLKKTGRSTAAKSPAGNRQKSPTPALEVQPPIKLGHLLILLVAGLAILAALSYVLESHWQQKQPVFQDAPKLVAALQAFSRDRFIHGLKMPPSVSLNDLVVGGYLSTNEIRAFEGIEVTISTEAKGTNSGNILIHARLPDGSVVALLGDGSVQQLQK